MSPVQKLKEKIAKRIRSSRRKMIGESNSIKIVTGSDIVPVGMGGCMFITHTKTITKTGHDNQLEFEKNQVILHGPAEDIHKIRCLDAMVGKLIKPFNGTKRVPEKVVKEINRHVADLTESFQRVSACRLEFVPPSVADVLSSKKLKLEKEVPVPEIQYTALFDHYAPGIGKVEQPIAKIKLNPLAGKQ